MARGKNYFLCVLNVKINPHSPEKYLQLFLEMFNLKNRTKTRGDYYGLIGSCSSIIRNEPLRGIYGYIYKYFDLIETADWYNIAKVEEATEEEIRKINIPPNLKPHFNRFAYVFFPLKHKLIVVINNENNKKLGPIIARDMFDSLLNVDKLKEKFNDVEVIVEQTAESIDRMFTKYSIDELLIKISRPNPDLSQQTNEEIFDLLKGQNIAKVEYKLQSDKSSGLKPNDDFKRLAKVALTNGVVKISGYDEAGNPIKESTLDHPYIESVRYDPKKHEFMQLIIQKAKSILGIS